MGSLRVWAAVAVAALGIGAGMGGRGVQPAIAGSWMENCSAPGTGRVACAAATRQSYADNTGGTDALQVSIRVQAGCRQLFVAFDQTIDIDRPVTVAVDSHPPLRFYTTTELEGLARSLDDAVEPDWGSHEFIAFYREMASKPGGLRGAAAGRELIARFAHVKEPRNLGMACTATRRLIPALRAGHMLHIAFQVLPHHEAAVYDWPIMTAREVSVPLDGLAAALDRMTAVVAPRPGTKTRAPG